MIPTLLRYWKFWVPPLVVLIFASWPDFRGGMIDTYGVGVAILALAYATGVSLLWWRRFNLLWCYWRWWLAGAVFAIGLFGVLAFFKTGKGTLHDVTLGGEWGKHVIGDQDVWGGLRLILIFLVASSIVAPRATYLRLRWFFWDFSGIKKLYQHYILPSRLGRWLGRQPAPTTEAEAEIESEVEPQEVEDDKKVKKPAKATPAQLQQLSKQLGKRYAEAAPVPTAGGWLMPPIDILDTTHEVEVAQIDNQKRADILEEALASYGVEAKVVKFNPGPAVTQFEVEPGWDRKYKEVREKDAKGNVVVRRVETSRTRVKVERIASLANDLALALAAPNIRIEAPVPGKSIVGIEVPNSTWGAVTIRSVIESPPFQRLKTKSSLALALGKAAGGEAVSADLSKMPHLLIAGATGSGKTVCLNTVICCLLMHNTPDEVRFVMIDPKRVELIAFNAVPHLLFPVVVETNRAIELLRWLNQEMDRRYKLFAAAGARNIESYNTKRPQEKMPYIVLMVDELADLMLSAFEEVEGNICSLAHQSRATGIHLVIATQRPSVDVVTGLIKANLPTRISFAVTSQVDSRTILDSVGAEKLLGRGDMLFAPTEATKPKRLQGCFVSDEEIDRLVNFWGKQRPAKPEMLVKELVSGGPADSLLEEARQLVKKHSRISASFLQRRLGIGLPKATQLLEQLQQEGLVRVAREEVEEVEGEKSG